MSRPDDTTSRRTSLLALGALGVVYGDIGTSPLYAMRESFESTGHTLTVDPANILGVLSLIVWSLIIVISIKYLVFVMRADNDGEGGILVLTSLLPRRDDSSRWGRVVALLGLFGTALLYGDGMITPAISVLAAMEGTEVAAPQLAEYAVPAAVVILVVLFAVQKRGTGAVGRAFGPIMLVWFSVLGVLGVAQVVQQPTVLRALSPTHGIAFFADNGLTGVLTLGSVFLVVTGGEALYADMGHFGHRPIALGWFTVVLPGLLLNYFGQGALLLSDPAAIDQPFYRLAPSWASIPLMVLATMATVIASQALISGAFSLTMQAVQFAYLPRVRIIHTSAEERGQIYVPAVNWALMVACVGLVLAFRTSSGLAAAYGVAVTMTMVITTVLFYVVARRHFGWSAWRAGLLCGAFMAVDMAFFAANVPKIPSGGWFPILVGGAVFVALTTWSTGRRLVRDRAHRGEVPLTTFVDSIMEHPPIRVEGTAVHLFGVPDMTPPPLIYDIRANHVLHEEVVTLTVVTERVPHVHGARRVRRESLGHGFTKVELHYGFMQEPRVADDLRDHCDIDPHDATFFLGRESVIVTDREGMAQWRERLFAFLRRNSMDAARYFHLPPDRVFEISTQVEL